MFRRTGNEFRKTEGGLCSELVDIQKNPPGFYTDLSYWENRRLIGTLFSEFEEGKFSTG
jgi:hypothetical protein